MAEALWKGHQVSLTRIVSSSHNDTALGPERWAQHMEDSHTQFCLVYSRQGTVYITGNGIPTNVEQLAHPDETPPVSFTWLQAGKQRPSILPSVVGALAQPRLVWPWLRKSRPLLLKAVGQVIMWGKCKELSQENPF